MRVLTVLHTTVYRYFEPVRLGEHRMMFRPRASYDLRLIETSLDIAPRPAAIHWVHDVFDNSVAVATFDIGTTELRFDSRVVLEHIQSDRPEYRLEPYARQFPFTYGEDERADLQRGTRRSAATQDVAEWAWSFLGGAESIETMALLRDVTRAINERFVYRARFERGVQTPSETLSLRQGTCRDFANLMIDAVRCLGFAARFVSGYIFVPEPDGADSASDGSTHAWLQVYLPGAGWVDFDPTNEIVGNRNLIRVAVAWDHAQILPLHGTFIGRPAAFQGMDVTVRVFETFEPPYENSEALEAGAPR